jgi:hypothetical protein
MTKRFFHNPAWRCSANTTDSPELVGLLATTHTMSAPSLALVRVIGNEYVLDVAKRSRTNQHVGFEDARTVGDFCSFVIQRMSVST